MNNKPFEFTEQYFNSNCHVKCFMEEFYNLYSKKLWNNKDTKRVVINKVIIMLYK